MVELVFQPEALDAVADKAMERNIGARGLRAVMEGVLTRSCTRSPLTPPSARVIITPEAVRKDRRAGRSPVIPSARSGPAAPVTVRRSTIPPPRHPNECMRRGEPVRLSSLSTAKETSYEIPSISPFWRCGA